MTAPSAAPSSRPRGRVREVLGAFLKLGTTSFGGPIAHLGFFRDELVIRRRWIDDPDYADLVALCQFLPGPASSQVGFALGLRRAGPWGAALAWLAFTLPSAILMIAFAYGVSLFDSTLGAGILTGLKVVAVAIVAQAVWGMARTLTPDARRASIAVGAALIVLFFVGSAGQIAAILGGALAGLALCREAPADAARRFSFAVSRRVGLVSLALFAVLLVALPILAARTDAVWLDIADGFYRAGALVFGGGHVVLPLLESEVVIGVAPTGWVTPEEFLAGYGAAQAVPGPLFTFAAYLGALAAPGAIGLLTAAVALVAVFLPGMLILIGVLPFYDRLRGSLPAQAMMRGAGAAVVGVLAAALYDPVFVTAIVDTGTFALALVCFVLLLVWRLPPWGVVLVGAAGGVLVTLT